MERENIKIIGKLILFLTPFCIGFYGIVKLQEGTLLDCAYKTVQLYVMEFGIESECLNWQLEIARWLAPIATAAVILSVLYSLVDNIHIWFKIRTQDMIAVHGNSANIDLVLKNLGKKAICSDQYMAFYARRHILMFENDFDMYHFMDENGVRMLHDTQKEIFLCSEKITRGNYENKQLVVCNIAENCARNYWEKFPIRDKKEKILIIGFDNYGQRILTQALLKNVIATDSSIEYHIVGNYHSYLAKHYKLDKVVHIKEVFCEGKIKEVKEYNDICDNHDVVYFYNMEWFEVLARGETYDRVIITEDLDAANIELLNELKAYYMIPYYYIKFSDEKILMALWNIEKENIIPFGVNEEMYNPETILKEKLFYYAKMIHARYYAKYSCDGYCNGIHCKSKKENGSESLKRCVNCPKLLNDWNRQSAFIRYSNVAQADHINEKLKILLGDYEDYKQGKGHEAVKVYMALADCEKERLWQIEHIRWNRYHFMNNWDYAPKRDNEKRLHHLLIPFSELSYIEKKKDEDAYLALGELLD